MKLIVKCFLLLFLLFDGKREKGRVLFVRTWVMGEGIKIVLFVVCWRCD